MHSTCNRENSVQLRDEALYNIMKNILLILTFFLASCTDCNGPNKAYLNGDWDAFQEACERDCSTRGEEANPSMDTTPWLCGCPDDLNEEEF